MVIEQQKELVRRVFEQALNQGQLAVIDELFSPAFIDHSTPEQTPGPSGVRAYFTEVRTGFPDLHVSIDLLLTEGELVALRTTWRGTHLGMYEGIAPTGRTTARNMLQIFRLQDGKIVEEWNEGRGLLESNP
jgi:predicted ester cyclase